MTVFSGRRTSVGIAREGTRGTGVAAAYWLPHTAITFYDRIERAVAESSYGTIAAPLTAYVTRKWAEGDIEGEIGAQAFGLILYAMAGTCTSDGGGTPAGGGHKHDFTLQDDNQCDSISIHVDEPVATDKIYELAMLSSLTLNVDLGEIVKYTAAFMSKAHADSSCTPAWTKEYHFTSPDLTFKVANRIGEIAAATKISLKSLAITFDKGPVERIDILGSLEPEDIVNRTFKITGNLELNYEDTTWRDYMLNGNVKVIQIKLINTREVVGTTTRPTLELVFPKVQFHTWEPTRGLDDVATQTINFEVFMDISTGTQRLWSTMQLLNNIATY